MDGDAEASAPHVFFCRAANGALSERAGATLNPGMSPWRNFDSGKWRRRVHRGARDIMFAVALTVTAVVLIGVAWLGNNRGDDATFGSSTELTRR
ncbi:MAG: hypothetical protein AB7L90_12420 [Hyphomicrobiaceae bacterium]